ncbi:battenin [Copidosoma floridanum]|uniref:battenin n=1 Tax=Copidosoma floridanum TaxID=29053 RepID=UPI0006C95312|nr:battenin [Copidosoma floridanum]
MSSQREKSIEAAASGRCKADPNSDARTGWRNLAAFWVLGLCNNYGYVVMLSAAHDILNRDSTVVETCPEPRNSTRSCNQVSTGAILLADILPCVFIKLTAPFLPFFVHARMATCVLFSATGFLLVSMSDGRLIMAVAGVVITSLSSGLGEVTLLSYSHRFSKSVISTWSSGTGGAGIIGALSYTWLLYFLSSKDTLLAMLVVPAIQAITFWLVLTHPEPTITLVTDNGGVGSQEQIIEAPKMSTARKIRLVPGLLKYMIPLGLVYLFEYFINQGLMVNVILLTFEAVYYYIPTIWIVFTLVLWEGLLGGAAYVNTFYRMSKEIPWEQREVSLGIASMADSIGIAMAGWLSMPVHNVICHLPLPQRVGS